MKNRNYITVIFDDESVLLNAVEKLKEKGETIADVLTPFPIHGLDEALSMRRTRIPVGGFIAGAIGTLTAFGFQSWVNTVSYPLIFGGKPLLAAPAFIPITFEVTILFGGLAMVVAFFVISGLKPDIRFDPVDPAITDDKFVILIDPGTDINDPTTRIRELLADLHPVEIRHGNQFKPE